MFAKKEKQRKQPEFTDPHDRGQVYERDYDLLSLLHALSSPLSHLFK